MDRASGTKKRQRGSITTLDPFRIVTERMELVAGDAHTVRAEKENRAWLADVLNATVPAEWPPDLNDLQMKDLSIKWFEGHPEGRGWLCWYFIACQPGERTLIGIGGFSDVPTADGIVEIGYSVLSQFQRRGYATEAVNGLCEWAFRHPDVRRVVAEIHPGREISTGVLLKCGFSLCSQDGGVATYQRLP